MHFGTYFWYIKFAGGIKKDHLIGGLFSMGNIAWSRRRELNPQPAAYKAAALPLSHFGIKNPPAQMRCSAYRSRRCGDGHTDFSERSGKEVVEMMTKRECGRLTDARLYGAYSVSERERRLKYRHRDGLCSTSAVAFSIAVWTANLSTIKNPSVSWRLSAVGSVGGSTPSCSCAPSTAGHYKQRFSPGEGSCGPHPTLLYYHTLFCFSILLLVTIVTIFLLPASKTPLCKHTPTTIMRPRIHTLRTNYASPIYERFTLFSPCPHIYPFLSIRFSPLVFRNKGGRGCAGPAQADFSNQKMLKTTPWPHSCAKMEISGI